MLQLAELLCDSASAECAQLPISQVQKENLRVVKKEMEGIGGRKKSQAREAERGGKVKKSGQ